MRVIKKWLPESPDQAILFMIIISIGIGYPVFVSRYGGRAVSLTDIITILYSPFLILKLFRKKYLLPGNFWYGPFILLLSFLISILIHIPRDGFISFFGWMRPAWLYITLLILISDDYEKKLRVISDAFVIILTFTVIIGITAWIAFTFFDMVSVFILIRPYYLGLWPVQMSSLDGHPNGAVQLIFFGICTIYFLNQKAPKAWIWCLGIIGIIATLSKSILIYLAVVSGYIRNIKWLGKWEGISVMIGIFLIGFYMFFSHFYPIKQSEKLHQDIESFIIPNQPVFKLDGYSFYQTIYSANKVAAVQAFISHPWSGVGPRNYIPFVENLRAEGKYKGTDRFLNPHCTYTSIAARFGLIGISGMIIFLFGIPKRIRNISHIKLKALFTIVYVTFGLEAITSDLEYARMFWFFNAWLTAHLFYQSSFARDHKKQSTQ